MRNTHAAMLLFAVAGCGPTLVPAEKALPDDAPGVAELRALLAPGQRVALREAPACDALVAPDLETLLAGQGTALVHAPRGKTPGLFRVDRSIVRLKKGDAPGLLAVKLVDDGGAGTWVGMETGKPLACLLPADEAIVTATTLSGKKVVFTPWKETCHRIEARGVGATSTLIENEAGGPLSVGGLVSLEGDQPWLGLERDTLRVPYDVLRDCFSDAGAKAGEESRGALALLRTPVGRCTRSDDGGKDHVECRSTVGVWEGHFAESARISLRLVRRTLGPVHFTDGRPVDGRRYARTVVAVFTGRPHDERERALYTTMEGSIAKALAEGDGSIRVATGTDPRVGYRLQVDATDLRIGELAQRQVDATSQYQDGERDVPNPAYAGAEAAARAAADQVEAAQRHHAEQVEQYQKNKETIDAARQVCLQGCDGYTNPIQRTGCKTACEGGSAVVGVVNGPPTMAEIGAAQEAAQRARETLASTPPTVKEPILKAWTYPKTELSRSASASLRVTLEPKGAPAQVIAIPLAHTWSDYEVKADGRHNVAGHDPDRGPIEKPEALVPWLAQKASEALAERLRVVLEQAEIEDAKKALAGSDKGKPGFEAVDAKAIDAAGSRLKQAAQRGRANLRAGSPLSLPSEAVSLGRGDCVLAVAVVEDTNAAAGLTLASADGGFADLRGKRFAVVEACQGDLPAGQDAVRLSLMSASGGEVRWGLYRTSGVAKAR